MFGDPMHIHGTFSETVAANPAIAVRTHDSGTAGKTVRIAPSNVLTLSHNETGKGAAKVLRSLIRIDREVVVSDVAHTVSAYAVVVRPHLVSVSDAASVARAIAAQILGIANCDLDGGTVSLFTAETDIEMLDLTRFLVGEP